jgi:uncharacterized membrane protein
LAALEWLSGTLELDLRLCVKNPDTADKQMRAKMVWYHYSIFTSLSLVGLVLCIRWLTNRGYQPKQILLFMVAIALVGFLGLAWPGLSDFYNSKHYFSSLLFIALAGVFAAIGHWADFEAIKRAPNPGYATALRNCSILPVIFLSVFIFNSELSPWKLAGAIVILSGIMGLVVDVKVKAGSPPKGKTGPEGKGWVLLSLAALSSYTLMVFAIKKATLLGLAPPEICAGIYIINLIFFTVLSRKEMKGYLADKAELKRFIPPPTCSMSKAWKQPRTPVITKRYEIPISSWSRFFRCRFFRPASTVLR